MAASCTVSDPAQSSVTAVQYFAGFESAWSQVKNTRAVELAEIISENLPKEVNGHEVTRGVCRTVDNPVAKCIVDLSDESRVLELPTIV